MNQSSCLAKWEFAICWLGIAMRRWKRAESRVNECKEGGGLKRGCRGGRIMPWHIQWASESSLHSRRKRRMVGFRSNTKAFTPLIWLTSGVTSLWSSSAHRGLKAWCHQPRGKVSGSKVGWVKSQWVQFYSTKVRDMNDAITLCLETSSGGSFVTAITADKVLYLSCCWLLFRPSWGTLGLQLVNIIKLLLF